MASVVIPRVLTELEERIRGAGRRAAAVAMVETQAAVVVSPLLPVNLGFLRRGIVVSEIEEKPDRLVAKLTITGVAQVYGIVMEYSRRAGARGPSWKHLGLAPGSTRLADGWRGSWVNRKLRGAVTSLAQQLRAARGGKGDATSFEKQAVFLLARAIARKIHLRGIAAKRFVASEVPNVQGRFNAAFRLELRAGGVTGGGA